jgi:F-type H+-transporting ATPase subunit epsilon
MPEKKFHLKIITPEKIVYENDIDAVFTKGVDGEFGVLFDHTPFMSGLDIGVTKVEINGSFEYISTIGGAFQFKNNEAVILTEAAERGKDIDITRAENAKKRAEARLGNPKIEDDIKKANLALTRAMVRLKAASKKH